MEDVNCLLCGSAEKQIRFRGRDLLHDTPGTFTLVECRKCGFLYLSPRPDDSEIQTYYPSDYLPYRRAIYEESSAFRRFDRLFGLYKRCQLIRQRKPRGHLLDIGCGTGDFLAVMGSQAGWTVVGMEPHPEAAERAHRQYGLQIDQRSLDDMAYPPDTFDVVTLWDVLEHLPQPVASLRQIRRIIRPDGILVVGLPNRDSVDARLFGRHWAGLDIPRHFSVFSATHLASALAHAGFSEPEILNLNGGYQTFALSTRFWLNSIANHSMLRAIALGTLYSLPTRLATFPYFLFLKSTRRGSTMVAVVKKNNEVKNTSGAWEKSY